MLLCMNHQKSPVVLGLGSASTCPSENEKKSLPNGYDSVNTQEGFFLKYDGTIYIL